MKLILREDENFSHTARDSVAATCAKPCPYKRSLLVLTPLWNVLWSWKEPYHDAIIDCLQPLYLRTRKENASATNAKHAGIWEGFSVSVPTPYLVKSSVLRWRLVLSRFYPRVQWSNKNTTKQGAVNSLWHKKATSRFALSLNVLSSSFVIITNG